MAEGLTWTVYDAEKMAAADVYGAVLCQLGETRTDIVALTGDLGKSTRIGRFQDKFPDRFFNAGIAEQNLLGMAAGLALSGLTPVVSTMAIFATMRAGEQLRTDICYQNLNVKVIATHSGTSFGSAGATHHCYEDLAVARSIANLTVIAPADGVDMAKALRAALDMKGPVYIRIGRGFEPPINKDENYDFTIGKAIVMRPGTDVTVVACGPTVYHAVQASRILEKEGISVRVINLHTIKPIDRETLVKAVVETRRIVTFEDHNVEGGMGSAVADVIAMSGKGCAFEKVGIPDQYSIIGTPEDIQTHYKIDTDGIIEKIHAIMGRDFEQDEDWADEV